MAQQTIRHCLDLEEPPKVVRRCPCHTTRSYRRHLVIAMGAVPCPIHPIGAFHWRHYHICDYCTGSAKFPPEKQSSSHWPIETLCIDSP